MAAEVSLAAVVVETPTALAPPPPPAAAASGEYTCAEVSVRTVPAALPLPHARAWADARGAAAQHLLSLEELAAKHGTHVDVTAAQRSRGLSPAEAAARLAVHGRNVLTPPKQIPAIIQFLLKCGARARPAAAWRPALTRSVVCPGAPTPPRRRQVHGQVHGAAHRGGHPVPRRLRVRAAPRRAPRALVRPWSLTAPPRPSRALSPRSLDTTQPVNLYLGIVLYGIVIATCIMTFLQGARRGGAVRPRGVSAVALTPAPRDAPTQSAPRRT